MLYCECCCHQWWTSELQFSTLLLPLVRSFIYKIAFLLHAEHSGHDSRQPHVHICKYLNTRTYKYIFRKVALWLRIVFINLIRLKQKLFTFSFQCGSPLGIFKQTRSALLQNKFKLLRVILLFSFPYESVLTFNWDIFVKS